MAQLFSLLLRHIFLNWFDTDDRDLAHYCNAALPIGEDKAGAFLSNQTEPSQLIDLVR